MSWLIGLFHQDDRRQNDGTFIRDAAMRYTAYYDGRISWDQVRRADADAGIAATALNAQFDSHAADHAGHDVASRS